MKWNKKALVVIFMGLLSLSLFGFGNFGAYCQQDYENNWVSTDTHTWHRCSYFNTEMKKSMTQAYYYNMVKAARFFETPLSSQSSCGVDTVDLLWADTHGGTWPNPIRSVLAMWDNWLVASTHNMRLGVSRLSIFATYACEVLKNNDGNFGARLRLTWRGGLRIWVGSHNYLYGGSKTQYVGEDFARFMRAGSTVKMAWRDALARASAKNDAAVAATGRNADECHYRKDTMKLNNYSTYIRLVDNSISYFCWTTWDKL